MIKPFVVRNDFSIMWLEIINKKYDYDTEVQNLLTGLQSQYSEVQFKYFARPSTSHFQEQDLTEAIFYTIHRFANTMNYVQDTKIKSFPPPSRNDSHIRSPDLTTIHSVG